VDLTIDGPGGLASQPCPEGASQSTADCARGRRRVVDGPVCPLDEQFVTSLTGVKFENDDWHVHTAKTPDLSDTGKAHSGQNSLQGPDLNLSSRGGSEMSFFHIAEFCDDACWAFLPDTGDEYGYSSPTFEPGDDVNPEDPANSSITMCLPNTVFLFGDCGRGELQDDPSLRTPDRVTRGETGVGV